MNIQLKFHGLSIFHKAKTIQSQFSYYYYLYITGPNCALHRRTILRLYSPGFQRKIFQRAKLLSERSEKVKEQKKNKGSVFFAEYDFIGMKL